jgi:hypothetical protein
LQLSDFAAREWQRQAERASRRACGSVRSQHSGTSAPASPSNHAIPSAPHTAHTEPRATQRKCPAGRACEPVSALPPTTVVGISILTMALLSSCLSYRSTHRFLSLHLWTAYHSLTHTHQQHSLPSSKDVLRAIPLLPYTHTHIPATGRLRPISLHHLAVRSVPSRKKLSPPILLHLSAGRKVLDSLHTSVKSLQAPSLLLSPALGCTSSRPWSIIAKLKNPALHLDQNLHRHSIYREERNISARSRIFLIPSSRIVRVVVRRRCFCREKKKV